ncbi:hypothetical protein AMAG_09241 [Allomyces macrogynus ATCC 38327]|uniref:Uncharacterized protein n=1 Tax=Allomyces macrogynus (strain ATCC 38327) TaxID=578462 RepID=A0A0L0SNX6_ALLM3|nr:hypothetical protein AMAG_09241 [Allomyces macrogynus ATCC 38327]|eukprot:KNE64197.1 hypothetical protein AMAG_09241 [Allomyces macrogynus ATCC 38327]
MYTDHLATGTHDTKAAPAGTTKATSAPIANAQAIYQKLLSLQAAAASQGIQVRVQSGMPFMSDAFLDLPNEQTGNTIVVENKTPRPISVHVKPYMNFNNPNGESNWAKPGKQSKWTRDEAQMVIVQYDGSKRDAVLATPGPRSSLLGPSSS